MSDAFLDQTHDLDSCKDVWDRYYIPAYYDFFNPYFDFTEIDDRDTPKDCKRWYIKLRKNTEYYAAFPKFKMAGDCVFNFNDSKIQLFTPLLSNSAEGKILLKRCAQNHHVICNFALMPITGGMNNAKGRNCFDRPDVHIAELLYYFNGQPTEIFSSCSENNRPALEWYLSLFDCNIYKYLKEIYFIEDKEFIDTEFLPFANTKIADSQSAIQYMKLALRFWELRMKK